VSSLPQVARAMQHVLDEVPGAAARDTGFCRRRSKLTAALFVQTVVLGWLAHPSGALPRLTQTAADLGLAVSPQGLAQRFGPAAAALLERVLAAAVAATVAAAPVGVALLARCNGVYLLDSSTVALPDALAAAWPGCGGRVARGGRAALKLTVRFDLLRGRLAGPVLSAGRAPAKASPLQAAPLPRRALRVGDLGFWSLAVLRDIAAQGAFFLSRLHLQTAVLGPDGGRLDLPAWLAGRGPTVDAPVALGASDRVPARLLAARVPQAVADERRRRLRAAAKREGKTPPAARLALAGWTLLVTNAPAARLSVAEALVLARARWQVELLFKLWKDEGQLDAWRSADPWRVLCEVYAKLIAMVVQHWVLLVGCWACADRSLTQAAQAVRDHAAALALGLRSVRRLAEALRAIRRRLAVGCRIGQRRRAPSTFQLLTDPALGGLA
jgi:Transposase DDE domain